MTFKCSINEVLVLISNRTEKQCSTDGYDSDPKLTGQNSNAKTTAGQNPNTYITTEYIIPWQNSEFSTDSSTEYETTSTTTTESKTTVSNSPGQLTNNHIQNVLFLFILCKLLS
jgi:hypothetical protein